MDSSLIAVAGTLLGVLLGAWLTYRFAAVLANDAAKRFAGVKLREAFAPELAKFSQPDRLNMIISIDILENAFDKHQIAVNEFRFYLTGKELKAFDRAWRDYYCAPDNQVDFSRYLGGAEEMKEALTRMEAIVAFTKH